MELGGRSGKVMACPEHPGRFYGRGKTELHTSSQGKIEKSGRGGGLVWGQKVVRPMPWGALSGSPRVRGQERVFWGLCGGFRAPVVQYLQYMQILIRYDRIHTDTYKYLHIHTYWRAKYRCAVIYWKIQTDCYRYMQIHAISYYKKKYPHILSNTYNTYQIPTKKYPQIVCRPLMFMHVFVGIW